MADLFKFVFAGPGRVHAGPRTHIWKVGDHEKDNGRLSHRQEAEKLIGRKVKVRDGDLLGVILRKPREGHIPEHLLVEPYFGSDVPSELLKYLEQHHPGVTAIVSHHTHAPKTKESSWASAQVRPDAAAWARENLLTAESGWFDRIKRLF